MGSTSELAYRGAAHIHLTMSDLSECMGQGEQTYLQEGNGWRAEELGVDESGLLFHSISMVILRRTMDNR